MAASGFSNVIFNRICMAQLPASRSILAVLGMAPANSIRLISWSVFQHFSLNGCARWEGSRRRRGCLSARWTVIELRYDMAVCFCRQDPFSASSGVYPPSSLILFKYISATERCVYTQHCTTCAHIYSFFFSSSSASFFSWWGRRTCRMSHNGLAVQ